MLDFCLHKKEHKERAHTRNNNKHWLKHAGRLVQLEGVGQGYASTIYIRNRKDGTQTLGDNKFELQ